MNSKLIKSRLAPIIIAALLLPGCEKEVPQYDIDSEIQKIVEEYDLPSISACVINQDNVVWNGSFGYANRELKIPASDETIYHIASISKLFIATAIMQLAEQNLLDIEKDINNYIPISIRNPNFPESPITVKMLLTHTSGIAWPQTYQEAQGLWEHFEPDSAPPPSEWVPQYLVSSGTDFNPKIWKITKPGTYELYSNIGCNVLAYITEQLTGENFRDYCMNHIFLPLEMHNTSYNYKDLDPAKLAVLYYNNNTFRQPWDDRIYASGGLKTTISDLLRFLMAYMNKGSLDGRSVLSEETINQMLMIQNEPSGVCLLWRASLGDWFGHTGGEDGAATMAEIHPESKTGLIIFCNKRSKLVYPGNRIYGLVRQKANQYIH